MKKTAKIVYGIFIGIIIFVAVLMIATLFPLAGNFKAKIVLSGSMEPTIHTGSVVVIHRENNYAVGDIVTFGKDTKKDVPTTHRIKEMRVADGKYVYRTKGDANKTEDISEVLEDAVIGKVMFTIPGAGYVLEFVKQPIGFLLLVIVPAVIIILDELRKIWNEVRKGKKVDNT